MLNSRSKCRYRGWKGSTLLVSVVQSVSPEGSSATKYIVYKAMLVNTLMCSQARRQKRHNNTLSCAVADTPTCQDIVGKIALLSGKMRKRGGEKGKGKKRKKEREKKEKKDKERKGEKEKDKKR